jgi:GR25 family glycosyltransferase involved in LPS biosynthesis
MLKVILTVDNATQERLDNAKFLANELQGQVHTANHLICSVRGFAKICKQAVDLNEDLLVLEDDVELCSDFLNKVNNAIEKYPNDLINFFNMTSATYTKKNSGMFFLWNQCLYIPIDICKMITTKTEKFLNQYPIHRMNQDVLIKHCLAEEGLAYVQYYPSLVQHKTWESTIDKNRATTRQTDSFDGE